MPLNWNGSIETRELRCRNIFGVSSCSYTRRYGQIAEDNTKGDHLAVMPNIPAGVHAAIDLIRDHYLTKGFFIPYFFGRKWSGVEAYGWSLAEMLGLSPRLPLKFRAFFPLPFKTWGDRLLRAVAILENGNPCRTIPAGFFDQFITEDV